MIDKTPGEIQPKAHYTHCHGHSISLSVTKQRKMLRKTMSAAEEILMLMKYSPKRENILGCIKEQENFDNEYETDIRSDIAKLFQTR